MRWSAVLMHQHVGRMFRAHWKVQGKRLLIDNGSLKSLEENGIEYEDANEVVKDRPKPKTLIKLRGFKSLKEAEKVEPYFLYGDSNVLVGGLNQAQIFSNSVQLPYDSHAAFKVENSDSLPIHDKLVKRCIRASILYDAYQEKLPIRKDPERPAWVFPRDYGITDRRKNYLLTNRLMQLCSSINPQLLAHRRTVNNLTFCVPFEKDGEKVVLNLRADSLLLSNSGLEPPSSHIDQAIIKDAIDAGIPDLYPLSQVVSIEKSDHADPSLGCFPLASDVNINQIHTTLIHYNPTEVANLYDADVSEDQILSRSLMKAYAIAVAQAREKFGDDVEDLPQPVTVQCIQTDSQNFHFSVLQLNTTACHSKTDTRNFYWSKPRITLFDQCENVDGIPTLEGYNPLVFQTLLSFYYSS